MKLISFVLILFLLFTSNMHLEAKKIKNSFSIKKEKKSDHIKLDESSVREINLQDSILTPAQESLRQELINGCVFAGYDKENSSSVESFNLINNSTYHLYGFSVRIDYKDMNGRMLHSREVNVPCNIPEGETRRIDIRSWDVQHTYYYFRGNAPRNKVATPFQVSFTPLKFRIEEISEQE